MEEFDVAIVGAGPAGLCLAGELSGSGLRILLLDRKKNAGDVQYNTSGSFIDPLEWGLPMETLNPVHSFRFSSAKETLEKKCCAYIIDRRKLLSFLESRAGINRNLEIVYGARVSGVKQAKNGVREISFNKDGSCRNVCAMVFADCSGTGSVLGRAIGIAPSRPVIGLGIEYIVPLLKEPNVSDLFVGNNLKGGYGWIFPRDSKTAIVGYGTLSRECFPGIEKRLRDMWGIDTVRERCELNPLERHTGVLRTGRPPGRLSKGNLIVIGDAALQSNPLVGEGVRFVMEASRIAARHVEEAVETNDTRRLAGYGREWHKRYRSKYLLAYMLQKRLKKNTYSDGKLDSGVRRVRNVSDKDFNRLLSGDLSIPFLAKVGMGSIMKKQGSKKNDALNQSTSNTD